MLLASAISKLTKKCVSKVCSRKEIKDSKLSTSCLRDSYSTAIGAIVVSMECCSVSSSTRCVLWYMDTISSSNYYITRQNALGTS